MPVTSVSVVRVLESWGRTLHGFSGKVYVTFNQVVKVIKVKKSLINVIAFPSTASAASDID